jgi:hypothetical protein
MDPVLITSIVGFSTLVLERLFKYFNKTRKSHCRSSCMGATIEIDKERDVSGDEKKS